MRIDLTKMQVGAVAAMLRDVLTEDERAYVDTLEGETDLFEAVRFLLERVEDDEGLQDQLATQIESRGIRKARAGERVKHNREAIMALIQCAGLDKLTLPEATLSVRAVPPKAIVTDEAAVPDALCKFTRKPDMTAIKAEVESGAVIPGVTLDNGGNSLTIRRK
jgi:Siphovirus Gp157